MSDYLITEIQALCPYCNAAISLLIDSSMDEQCYIEDCEVCCRPMTIRIDYSNSALPRIDLTQENEVG